MDTDELLIKSLDYEMFPSVQSGLLQMYNAYSVPLVSFIFLLWIHPLGLFALQFHLFYFIFILRCQIFLWVI